MSRPLKVLFVTTVDLTAWCFMRPWMSFLARGGAEVTLACTVERFRDDLEATGAQVLHLPISRRLHPLEDLASLLDLFYLMRRLRPDLVHTNTSKAGFLGRLAARLAGVPLVIHTIYELPENSTENPWLKAAYRGLEFLAARWADHLITISEPNRRQILAQRLCPPDKLTLIPEALELSRYQATRSPREVRAELGIPQDALLVGSVGRLEPAKGHAYLLEAFHLVLQRIPQARLVLVGRGYLEEELRRRIHELGIQEQVILAGFRDDLIDLLGALDVFALASLYEGLGVATMEAMAMSRPTVCTGVGGVPDVVVDGQTGYLVEPRAPAQMAERLVELLSDPEKAWKMGQAGRRRVEEHFRVEDSNRKLHCLYQNLLMGRRRRKRIRFP
ncbi:MAG: glycosyltransferase family 4 protein [Candidatus Xenobium sp.]|jgi:glycosyltransferase involved in cell wall biosynthesis|nr:glycosyltransferase family 4 protein [Burkholderiales bacterium]